MKLAKFSYITDTLFCECVFKYPLILSFNSSDNKNTWLI